MFNVEKGINNGITALIIDTNKKIFNNLNYFLFFFCNNYYIINIFFADLFNKKNLNTKLKSIKFY